MRRNRLGRSGGHLNNSKPSSEVHVATTSFLRPGESVTELLLILVIEDEYFAMRDVEAALADGGFATEAVSSGEEALTLFMGSVKNYSAFGYRCSSGRQSEWMGRRQADHGKGTGLPRHLRDGP